MKNVFKFKCGKSKKKRKFKAVFTIWLPYIDQFMYLRGVKSVIIPADKKAFLTATWTDKKGNPANIDGVPTWQTTSTTIAPLEAPNIANGDDPNGIYVLGGVIGLAQVSVTADVNLDPNTVKPLSAVLDVETIAGEAFVGTINAGTLIDQ